MPNVQLEEVLYKLSTESLDWFFSYVIEPNVFIDPTDLMCLPKEYIQKIEKFVSFHTFEALSEMEPKDFIEQSTGEKASKILKLLKVGKKIKSIEQDFL